MALGIAKSATVRAKGTVARGGRRRAAVDQIEPVPELVQCLRARPGIVDQIVGMTTEGIERLSGQPCLTPVVSSMRGKRISSLSGWRRRRP